MNGNKWKKSTGKVKTKFASNIIKKTNRIDRT